MLPFPFQLCGFGKSAIDGDQYFNNVSLLLHCDGANASNTFTDSSKSPKTISVFNQAQISTAESKFGGSSALFNATADYITAPTNADFSFGSGDFTVEAFIRPSTSSAVPDRGLIVRDEIGGTRGWLFFVANTSGNLSFAIWQGASSVTISQATDFMSTKLNTWAHIAASRSGTTLKLFVDGTEVASNGSAGLTIGAPATPCVMGTLWSNTGRVSGTDWQGNMDDIRITKGVARYTANFTAPPAPFPNY